MSACPESGISPIWKRRKCLMLLCWSFSRRHCSRTPSACMHSPTADSSEDPPIFAPDAFRITEFQAELIGKARRFGRRVLAPRAAQHDREASFPLENFHDMHREGLLG